MVIWQMEKLDENLPIELEDILNRKVGTETELAFVRQDAVKSDSIIEDHKASMVPAGTQVIVSTLNLCVGFLKVASP